ncbi:MAG: RHS repeat-associated core domain-containing protein, partial [Bacteroidota bacterium]
LYDASGRKWAMEYPDGTIRLYIAGMEFVDGIFESLNLGDGRIYAEPGTNGSPSALLAEYWHKDHPAYLGEGAPKLSIRVAFTDQNGDRLVQLLDDGSGNPSEVNQILDYYPFGLQHPGQLCTPEVEPENAYRYNGKELLEDVGLYDYGARYYDPAIARWNAVDPLADEYGAWSPYNYVLGNPLKFIDPDGMQVDDIIEIQRETGQITITEAAGDDEVRLVDANGAIEDDYTYGENGSFTAENDIVTTDNSTTVYFGNSECTN